MAFMLAIQRKGNVHKQYEMQTLFHWYALGLHQFVLGTQGFALGMQSFVLSTQGFLVTNMLL